MIKLGLIGANRSSLVVEILKSKSFALHATSFFEPILEKRLKFAQRHPDIVPVATEDEILYSNDIEAVYIASPIEQHYTQTMKALRSGKHVLCEVPIILTLDQGIALLEQKSPKNVCMMAENFCFTPTVLALEKLISDGCFGEITFIRTGYFHDCKNLAFDNNSGALTWRGQLRKDLSGNDYPTHSIGPVYKLLNTKDNISFDTITTFTTKESAMSAYARERYPSIEVQDQQFERADLSLSLIRTTNNILIELLLDTVSNRPDSLIDLYIQGTNGCFMSGRFDNEQPLLYFNKITNGFPAKVVHPIDTFDFLSSRDQELRKSLGRLFPLYKTLEEFQNAIIDGREPLITTEQSILWSSIIELSKKSVYSGSQPVKFFKY